jgi:hypothetical protein
MKCWKNIGIQRNFMEYNIIQWIPELIQEGTMESMDSCGFHGIYGIYGFHDNPVDSCQFHGIL